MQITGTHNDIGLSVEDMEKAAASLTDLLEGMGYNNTEVKEDDKRKSSFGKGSTSVLSCTPGKDGDTKVFILKAKYAISGVGHVINISP